MDLRPWLKRWRGSRCCAYGFEWIQKLYWIAPNGKSNGQFDLIKRLSWPCTGTHIFGMSMVACWDFLAKYAENHWEKKVKIPNNINYIWYYGWLLYKIEMILFTSILFHMYSFSSFVRMQLLFSLKWVLQKTWLSLFPYISTYILWYKYEIPWLYPDHLFVIFMEGKIPSRELLWMNM